MAVFFKPISLLLSMKRFNLYILAPFLTVFAPQVFVSCSRDDDKTPPAVVAAPPPDIADGVAGNYYLYDTLYIRNRGDSLTFIGEGHRTITKVSASRVRLDKLVPCSDSSIAEVSPTSLVPVHGFLGYTIITFTRSDSDIVYSLMWAPGYGHRGHAVKRP